MALFKDLDKACTDLFKKEFMKDGSKDNTFGVEVKTKTPNGIAITANNDQKGAKTSASLKLESSNKDLGIKITEKWTSSNELNFCLDHTGLADGLKATVDVTYQEDGVKKIKKVAKGAFEYKAEGFNATGAVTYGENADLNGVNSSFSGVFFYENFFGGVSGSYPLQNSKAKPNAEFKLGCKEGSFTGHLFTKKFLTTLGGGFVTQATDDISVAGRLTVLREGEALKVNRPKIEIGSQFKIDSSSFAKAKVDTCGVLGLAYNTKLNSNFTLGVGSQIKTKDFIASKPSVLLGFSLKFSA